MDQAGFQSLAASQGAQGVFDYAKNNGISLDQLAQIGGVSTDAMAQLAQSQGINTGMLSQIGYQAPAPVYSPPPAGTPAISGKTGMMDVTTGQFKYFGTPEYDAWEKGLTGELNQLGITMDEYKAGGVGARLMSNPLTDAYSSAFTENNTTGGGQAWAQGIGGQLGYGQANGFVDANGYATGKGSELGGGLSNTFKQYMTSQQTDPRYASGNQPGQINKTPTGLIGGGGTSNGGTSGNAVTGQNPVSGGSYTRTTGTTNFNPSTDTTRGQVNSILAEDSEIKRQAETAALQQMNARGLLNSSIANTAGRSAVIQNALAIGDPTANQYQKAKITTQELDSRMDLANLDADTRLKIAELSNEESSNQNALGNYRAIASQMNDAINQILTSPTLTAEAKQQAINSVLMYHDQYLQFQDSITGLNLSGLVSYE